MNSISIARVTVAGRRKSEVVAHLIMQKFVMLLPAVPAETGLGTAGIEAKPAGDVPQAAARRRIIYQEPYNELLAYLKSGEGHLKSCGTVNKEKDFAKAVLRNVCKNIPVNKL